MKDESERWFKLFASCRLVHGKAESLLYDTERNAFYAFSNEFIELLTLSENHSISGIKSRYEASETELIDSFFNQFIEQEIGFYTTEPLAFPDIDLTWESPYPITNAIIEFDGLRAYDIGKVLEQLSSLGCRAVQLCSLNTCSQEELQHLLQFFKLSRIHHVELLMPYDTGQSIDALYELIKSEPRLNIIVIYGAPTEEVLKHELDNLTDLIIYLKKDIRIDSKERIRKERFTTNIHSFSEAQHFNIGLNRKICIDRNGNIKNYTDHIRSFGNVTSVAIKDVIHLNEFQKNWFIPIDKVETCKECQYRYACVSNSDLIEKKGSYFKKHPCNFDPVKNIWNE